MPGSEGSVGSLRHRLEKALVTRLTPKELHQVRQALDLSERAHHGQVRDDGTPYVLHPLRVAGILLEDLGIEDPDILQAALLHDALEDDPNLNADALCRTFGANVASTVTDLTKAPRGSRTREEANREYFARLRSASEIARLVKLADKLDNVRDAVNCPDPGKRSRTATEARELFALLTPGLTDSTIAAQLKQLLTDALERLEQLQ